MWPESGNVRLYVEILLELEIPFASVLVPDNFFHWLTGLYMKIFAIASPNADIPTELIEKASSSGFAMISKWCPQQMILSHPVRLYHTVIVITSDPHS